MAKLQYCFVLVLLVTFVIGTEAACHPRCRRRESCIRKLHSNPPEYKCIRTRCTLPSFIGRCRASKRRYFFNTQTQQCEQFIYGGCRGNTNRFRNMRKCQRVCHVN